MKKVVLTMLLVCVYAMSAAGSAFAVSSYATAFKAAYPSSALSSLSTTSGQAGNLCTVCHGASGGTRNTFGSNFASSAIAGHANHTFDAALGALDSDGDGAGNITEINAGTFPGNASSTPPTTGDTTKPVVTFSMPATSSSLTVALTFSATDNVAVTGYMLTGSATAPLASAGGWTATAPASYTFASAGANTLYAWTKDAAGNVSLSKSAGTTITLPPAADTTKPAVTFSMPATSSSLTVALTFSATDNVAVTGYMATGSATAPLASAGGWTATAPASYTFASAGANTLYAWAKDAAGNVSLSKSAGTTITLPSTADTTKPIVNFSLPATASSLTVALTLSATDNVAVTGYMATESATAPLASAAGWTASAPASYTFTSAGAKTLYTWAKDAAGNVSLSKVASVTITLPAVADKRGPRINSFRVKERASSLTVPIKAFVAVDKIGVTGYQVSESPTPDDNNWSATAPTSHTFATPGRKKLFGFVKDGAGNVSRARARVVIKLPAIATEAVEPAAIDTAAATAAPKQIYSYDPVSSPVRSSNAAEAKPVAIGPVAEGGDNLSLQISIALPDGSMDAYVTVYSPSETIADPVIVYTLTAGNELVPLTSDKKPWRSQVTDINEVILEIPAAELLPGKYLVSFELTPTGTQDTNYLWWTYFIVE